MELETTKNQSKLIGADLAIGMTLNQAMFYLGVSRSELARRMGTSQPTVSMKLRGQVRWSAEDVLLAGEALGVDARDIMPMPDGSGGWLPAPFIAGKARIPALAGDHVSYPGKDSNLQPTD